MHTLAGLGVAGRLTDRKDASKRDFCCRTPMDPVTDTEVNEADMW